MNGTGAAYIRVSRRFQENARQHDDIRRWCELHGVKPTFTIEDQGSRDKAESRIGLQRLLSLARSGQINWIVIQSLDRFGIKDSDELGHRLFELKRHGCELWSVADDLCVTADDERTTLINVIGAMTSSREQFTKGNRSITKKIEQAKLGEWTGGYPPYGLDLVCKRGNELVWRLVYEGKHKRIQHIDGKMIRWDGEGNVPPHAQHETIFAAPSIAEERLEVVRTIFGWFANEAITTGKIADRLNDRGIPPIYSEKWYATLIEGFLKNPIYTGFPHYNKNAQGRFFEYVDGQVQKAPRKNSYYAITGRKRESSDRIKPDQPIFEPIIGAGLYEKVQAKLLDRSKGKRSPKSQALWLGGLVVCGKCGERMSGSMYASEKGDQRSYLCSTTVRYGKNHNPHGCLSHRVLARTLEEYVGKYLCEVGIELDQLQTESPSIESFKHEESTLRKDWMKIVSRAVTFIDGSGAEADLLDLAWYEGKPLPDGFWSFYRGVFEANRARIDQQLAEKRRTLNEMVERFLMLTSDEAIKAANEVMERISVDIKALEAQLEPLDETHEEWQSRLFEWKRRVHAAKQSIESEGYGQKAEAARSVISKIVCHFDYRQHGQQTRSILREVEIYPLVGDPVSFSNESRRGRDLLSEGFRRIYRRP